MNKSPNENSNNESSLATNWSSSELLIIISGILLLICFSFIAYISPEFAANVPELEKPVLLLVGVLIFSAVIYLFTIYKTPKTNLRNK